jgi:hypothetical protein
MPAAAIDLIILRSKGSIHYLQIGNHGDGYVNMSSRFDGQPCSIPTRARVPDDEVKRIMEFVHETFPQLKSASLIESKVSDVLFQR